MTNGRAWIMICMIGNEEKRRGKSEEDDIPPHIRDSQRWVSMFSGVFYQIGDRLAHVGFVENEEIVECNVD